MEFDRRGLLAGGLAALGGCASGRIAVPAKRRHGLAEITIMPELLRDCPGTLRWVAEPGYTTMGVRLVGYRGVPDPGEPTAADKARLLRDAGLELGVSVSAFATRLRRAAGFPPHQFGRTTGSGGRARPA